MPQEFHVLQCHKCKTFQVQQVKKVLKWSCKLCGEKQSVLRVYGRGSGADCRKHVQNLNKLRGEVETNQDEKIVSAKSVEEADVHFNNFQIDAGEVEDVQQNTGSSSSKWCRYIEPMISEDDGNNNREDESRYTTDRSQYNTVNKQYRKYKRESYKHQPYTTDRNKIGKHSRWKNTPNYMRENTMNDFSENDPNFDFNTKTLPPACLSSKPAKRTKWDNFMGDHNQENTLECSQVSNLSEQPYRNVSNKTFAKKTKIMGSGFNLLDSFLNKEFDETISNSRTGHNVPKSVYGYSKTTNVHAGNTPFESTVSSSTSAQNMALKTKISNTVPQRKSKWEAFTNISQDEDSEFYIPNDSLVYDDLHPGSGSNSEENAPDFVIDNLDFLQRQNKEAFKGSPSQTDKTQVYSSVASNMLKSNPKKMATISGSKTWSALKCAAETLCNKVPDRNIIPSKPRKDEMFQVNDFDDAEFEFVI